MVLSVLLWSAVTVCGSVGSKVQLAALSLTFAVSSNQLQIAIICSCQMALSIN